MNQAIHSALEYDVVVAGGGTAGIAAALAAARQGAKTVLLEKEYCLGGLATLGLIVIYLPLCDGAGTKMSSGICEELIRLSVAYDPNPDQPDEWAGPGRIPMAWLDPDSTIEERAAARYRVTFNQASFMMLAEKLLIQNGVTILYDARVTDVRAGDGRVESVIVASKLGPVEIRAKSFVDCTGDSDVCYFAGEETYDNPNNVLTGWHFTNGNDGVKLVGLSDRLQFDHPSPETKIYSGTDLFDISRHMIDMHAFIMASIDKKRETDPSVYPLIIPSFHGLRMTRRLAGTFEFSELKHERVWFDDAVGMIGNWKKKNQRFSIPLRSIKAVKNNNLYAAGRCACADVLGWDLLRVIPSCAVTGEAAGTAAAMQAKEGEAPDIRRLQNALKARGVLLDPSLFETRA